MLMVAQSLTSTLSVIQTGIWTCDVFKICVDSAALTNPYRGNCLLLKLLARKGTHTSTAHMSHDPKSV